MQKSIRFMASVLILGAYLLSACTGAAPSQSSDPAKVQKVDSSEVVFTGIVEEINGNQWTVNGQAVVIDGLTALDANIKVGDTVKVEASVLQDGSVMAVKIESSGADDANSNSSNDNSANANSSNVNDANANSSNVNDANVNSNDNSNVNDNSNSNSNSNGNEAVGGQDEVTGVVEVITSDTITIDGVVYNLADFTEFKGGIAVGDQVKIHVIVNADGTLTIREIEKSAGLSTDDNSNGNSNSNDQVGNFNGNSNGDDNGGASNNNSNGDDSGGGSNDNSGNDDNGGNSNSNDD